MNKRLLILLCEFMAFVRGKRAVQLLWHEISAIGKTASENHDILMMKKPLEKLQRFFAHAVRLDNPTI